MSESIKRWAVKWIGCGDPQCECEKELWLPDIGAKECTANVVDRGLFTQLDAHEWVSNRDRLPGCGKYIVVRAAKPRPPSKTLDLAIAKVKARRTECEGFLASAIERKAWYRANDFDERILEITHVLSLLESLR